MLLRFLLAVAAVGCSGHVSRKVPGSQIGGGEKVTVDKIPYQLALEYFESFFCGASIIGENWALSAGHCVVPGTPEKFRLRSGTSWQETSGTLHQVVEIIRHENYSIKTTHYDLAVLRVNTPFNPQHIIGLAKVRPAPGKMGTVSGWGATEHRTGSFYLLWAFVPLTSQSECLAFYGQVLTEFMLCAGEPGKSACAGDSGGPLVVDDLQIGVVSMGYDCAGVSPEVYSDVAFFREWIVNKTGLVDAPCEDCIKAV